MGKMHSFRVLLFSVIFLSIFISNVSSIYTHAAFVNAIRQSEHRDERARTLSTTNPNEEYSLQMNNTALFGLPSCSPMQCQRIAVVGAGIAGLTIAYELTRAGHDVIVFEGSDRSGGRLFTYDTGKTIIELGGMRLPLDIHTLTDIYLRKRFHLPLEPFISYHPNTFIYINGIKRRSDNTSFLPQEYHLQVHLDEQQKSPFVRWNEAIKPLMNLFFTKGWNAVVDKYGSYDVKQYLSEFGLSNQMIDYIGLMFGIETNFFTSLTSHFRDALLINEHTQFYHILGGNQRFVDQLAQSCQIKYSSLVLAINRNENRTVNITIQDVNNKTTISTFDRVVVATTAPAARLIRYTPMDEQVKQMSRALRQLHYDCSSKIVLYFSYPWWHDQNIYGGSTTTDLPLRFIYYDNYNTSSINDHNQTEYVLLASYSFAQDATLWSSSTIDQITREALNNLEEIHSRSDLRTFHLRTIVKHWCADSMSHGAYALFLPYQEKEIKPILMNSLDRLVYFAGEHLSTAHAWVEGAILSALNVLIQIQDEQFDIVIIGGGLLALQTAREIAHRQPKWHILLLEEQTLLNSTCLNQFEPSKINNSYLQFGPHFINGQLNSTDLMTRYYFSNLSHHDRGQVDGRLTFVDTTKMIREMLKILQEERYSRITIAEQESFVHAQGNEIITNRRTLIVHEKMLFLDNCYVNKYVQESFHSSRVNVQIKQYPFLSFSSIGINSLPTWLYNNQILGFDVHNERKIILFNSNLSLGLSWLREHTSSLIDFNQLKSLSDYQQTTLIDHGHIIDYLPQSNNRTIIFVGRTNIDLYSIWIDILADLTFDIYQPHMSNYSISLPNRLVRANSSFRLSLSMNILFFSLFYSLCT